ncbi:MAG: hypothetical protein K9K79_05670 [Desulfohalobiaceae bacterium]|nr:hypothetical protein [Desulfohalobiaceae bacterium]
MKPAKLRLTPVSLGRHDLMDYFFLTACRKPAVKEIRLRQERPFRRASGTPKNLSSHPVYPVNPVNRFLRFFSSKSPKTNSFFKWNNKVSAEDYQLLLTRTILRKRYCPKGFFHFLNREP